jgi:hypothetical protein
MKTAALILFIGVIVIISGASQSLAQGIPLPYRIVGTVTIDGVKLTQSTDDGLIIKVTKADGTAYTDAYGNPSEDEDGLNTSDFYLIDIPIYSAMDQPGGGRSGETTIIHVYRDNKKLYVSNPMDGRITIGSEGSVSQIDLTAVTGQKWSGPVSLSLKMVENYTDDPGNIKIKKYPTETYPGTIEIYLGEEGLIPNEEGCYFFFISEDEKKEICIQEIAAIYTQYIKINATDTFYLKGIGAYSSKEEGEDVTGIIFLDLTKGSMKKDKLGNLISITLSGKIGGGTPKDSVFSGSFKATLTK